MYLMKILAFAATNSRNSINRALLDHALSRFQKEVDANAEIEILDLNDFEMPIYSVDREQDTGIPAAAKTFFEKIGSADAVLVSFAEHNGFVTAAWKNIFDWMSRLDMKLWQNKPLITMAATPGPRAGANVLQTQAMLTPHFGGEIRGSVGIGQWGDAFDPETGSLTRDEDIRKLGNALAAFALEPA
jgi:chromate reductase, NAD(P)H dehydrogenase (quinone)